MAGGGPRRGRGGGPGRAAGTRASGAAPASGPAGGLLSVLGRFLLLVPGEGRGGGRALDGWFVQGDADPVREGWGELRRGRRGMGGGVLLLQEVPHRRCQLV